jgi:hypothetical protein
MNKIFQFITGDLFKSIGGIIDDVVTTKEEKEQLKNQLVQTMLSAAMHSEQLQAAIIQSEANGNKLQRNWRPIVMLAFAGIVVFQFFLYPILRLFNPQFPELDILTPDFWGLLQIGIGGYVIGRTAEKIVPQLKISK